MSTPSTLRGGEKLQHSGRPLTAAAAALIALFSNADPALADPANCQHHIDLAAKRAKDPTVSREELIALGNRHIACMNDEIKKGENAKAALEVQRDRLEREYKNAVAELFSDD